MMSAQSLSSPTVVPEPVEDTEPRGGRRSSVTPGRCLVAVLAALVLVVGVPVALVDWGRNSGTPVNVVLALLLVAVSAGRLAQAIAFDRREMARSMFYVFVYVFLAVPALAQSVSGRYPLDGLTYDSSTVSAGLLHILAGVIAYEVGWRLRRRRTDTAGGRAGPSFSFSAWRCVVIGAIGLGFAFTRVAQLGVAAFFTSRADTTAALTGTEGTQTPYYMTENKAAGLIIIFLSQVLVFVALFVILYARRHRLWPTTTPRQDFVWRLYIAVLIAANVVMNNPMGNGRFWFSIVIVAFLSIYVPYDRPNSQRFYVCSALFILFFSFASLDLFRAQGSTLEISGPGTTFVDNGTYAMFQMELNSIRFVEDEGNTDGQQMLGYVFNFVPRQLWSDKPIPTGQLVDPPSARSTTAWSELYVDFGVVGVVVFFAVYGSMSRRLTERSRSVGPGLLHAGLPILAVFQLLLLRGSLLPVVGALYQLIFVFACLLTWHASRQRVMNRPSPMLPVDHVNTGRAA